MLLLGRHRRDRCDGSCGKWLCLGLQRVPCLRLSCGLAGLHMAAGCPMDSRGQALVLPAIWLARIVVKQQEGGLWPSWQQW
jgi:hypothetical protein